jgi:uncharacterized protein (TIGR03435 family)
MCPDEHRCGILLVDDDSIRNLVKAYLEKAGYTVFAASDGDIGLALFKQKHTKISTRLCTHERRRRVTPVFEEPKWYAFSLVVISVILGLLISPYTRAQPVAVHTSFEVASIKRNAHCGNAGVPGATSPGKLNMTCATLRGLIRMAYSGVVGGNINSRRLEVLGGPSWLDTERYDLSAKAEGNPPVEQMIGPMLQSLLEERFGVRTHMELRDAPVYVLTLAKDGPRLQPSKDGSCIPMDLNNLPSVVLATGELRPKYCGWGQNQGNEANMVTDWYGVTMAEFAGRMLPSFVDRAVVDNTGLTGRYDVHLEFVRDNAGSGPIRLNGIDSPGSPASSADQAGPFNLHVSKKTARISIGAEQRRVGDYCHRPRGQTFGQLRRPDCVMASEIIVCPPVIHTTREAGLSTMVSTAR